MEDIPLRPTGHMERFNITRNHVKFYNNVQVAATYTIPRSLIPAPNQAGFESLIYSTLSETLKSQAIFGVTIDDEGTKEPKWRRLETIDLREVVNIIEQDPNTNPDRWIQAAHYEQFDKIGELPIWRAVVAVQEAALTFPEGSTVSFTLAFFFHHAIGDGLSGGALHLNFLDALNYLIKTPESIISTPLVRTPIVPLLPSLEMSTELPVSIWFALKQIFKAFIYNPVDLSEWSGSPIPTSISQPLVSNLHSFSLPLSTVGTLVSRCREHKTTVTSLLSALIARKLALMYPDFKHFTGTIPFSMRKFSGHSPRDMGVFVTNVLQHFSSEASPPRGYISCSPLPGSKSESAKEGGNDIDENLWSSARAVKKIIEDGSRTPKNQKVGLLRFVGDYVPFFNGMLGGKRDHAFEVTNIGVIDGEAPETSQQVEAEVEGKKAWFEKVLFSSALCAYGDPFCVSVATAKGGWMTVAVNWETGVVAHEEGEELVGWLEGVLRGLGEA